MNPYTMLTITQAREQIDQHASAIQEHERVPLAQAYKRVLAEDCVAQVDAPPADNSAMDGYAFKRPTASPPWHLRVSQIVNAGNIPQALEPGTAARLFTGANLPPGADTIAMQEDCDVQEAEVVVRLAPRQGANIRPRGQDFQRGQVLAHKGCVLHAAPLGLLAAGGLSEVQVVRAPRIALIHTGSELVTPGTPLQEGQIYNSNGTMLSTLLTGWGCIITRHVHVIDDFEQTKCALQSAADDADLIITSGGVSVGDADHVKAAIRALGQLTLWKIRMKPGKPLAFGLIHNGKGRATPIMGLPGNPVSSFVTAVCFAKVFINGLYGRAYSPMQVLHAPVAFHINEPQKRPEFIRVQFQAEGLVAHPNQSSGVLSSLAWADGLALIEPHCLPIHPGDSVPYYPLLQLTEL